MKNACGKSDFMAFFVHFERGMGESVPHGPIHRKNREVLGLIKSSLLCVNYECLIFVIIIVFQIRFCVLIQ